jgi:FkbM family methyltransferase
MIDFAAIPSSTRLGRALRVPLRLVPRDAYVRILSGPLRGVRWRVGSSNHGCWLGTYELEKQRSIAARLRLGMVAYDVGANVGFYTLLFSKLVGESGKVFAFEPFPENLVDLLAHLRLNGADNCRAISGALAREAGIAPFREGPSNSMGALAAEDAVLRVPTMSLDALVDAGVIPPPDLVKIDVEGAEAAVLEGARGLLQRTRAIWFVALHGAAATAQTETVLRGLDYRLFRLDGSEIAPGAIDTDEVFAVP